jgi:hypothetical protein
MKLYELKKGQKFKFSGEDGQFYPEEIEFDHVDGMYSVCWDPRGALVHVFAASDVEVQDGK